METDACTPVRCKVAPVLVLEDVNRSWHHFAHATGDRRRWLLAEIKIQLGRLDPTHPRVAPQLAEVERIELAEVQP